MKRIFLILMVALMPYMIAGANVIAPINSAKSHLIIHVEDITIGAPCTTIYDRAEGTCDIDSKMHQPKDKYLSKHFHAFEKRKWFAMSWRP